jgi:hypothetical protein
LVTSKGAAECERSCLLKCEVTDLRTGAKRAAGKIGRETLIKRREGYFDLLVSGYSTEQIASHAKTSPSAVRRAVGQTLAKRQFDAPEDYARPQVARLTEALRCADVSLEEGDLKAIAPFVKIVRELNLYHGVNVGSTRTAPGALPKSRRHRRRSRSRIRRAWPLQTCSRTKRVAQKSR